MKGSKPYSPIALKQRGIFLRKRCEARDFFVCKNARCGIFLRKRCEARDFLFDEIGKRAYHFAILNFWERYCNGTENY